MRLDNEWTKAKRRHCTSIFLIKKTKNNVYQVNKPGTKSGDYSGGHYIGGHAVMMGKICGGKLGIRLSWMGFKDSKFNGWERTERIDFGNINHISRGWNDIVMRWDTSEYRNGNSKLKFYMNGKKISY